MFARQEACMAKGFDIVSEKRKPSRPSVSHKIAELTFTIRDCAVRIKPIAATVVSKLAIYSHEYLAFLFSLISNLIFKAHGPTWALLQCGVKKGHFQNSAQKM